ncbi:MAG TPA: PQ-loop domain-containing transporter [Acidimicrobiia bacterium]|nr:PQ-loop domain-containing transporter [Acidimicrobiia bacterium]
MTLATAVVVLATIIAWWSLIPQIRKLLRTADATGVSITWPVIGLISNAAWSAYLASQGLWPAVPSTVVMVFFYVAVIRALRRTGAPLGAALFRGVLATALLTTVFALGSWPILGLVLGWAYVPQLAPAVWAVYRIRRPTGVAVGTWTLIGVEAALWTLYGALLDDTPVVVFGGVGIVAAVWVVVRVAATVGRGSQK